MTPRWWAAVTLAALLAAVALIAALRVPWSGPPTPRADQIAALRELPADAVARGRAFHTALRPSTYAGMGFGLVVALVLGLTPLGAALVRLAGRPFNGHWLAEALLGGLLVVFAGELVGLPFAAWRQVVVRRYGLSTQGWGGWAVDLLKGYAIGAVLGALVLVVFYTVTHFAPRWWWAFAAAGAAGLTVLLTFVFPVLVEPVFNKFTPLEPGQLRSDLIAMADRDGVPVRDVLVADASRRTRAVNAYVSGLGPTRRIVVYDTLLRQAPPAEVESVVAHELGHAKDGDVVTGTLIGALGAAAGVCALYLLGSWAGLLRRAGVDSLAEPRAVALLLAVATVAGLVAAPLQNAVSRRIEARADRHALALTGDPVTFEAMQARLSQVNLSDPDPNPVEYALFASHPSTVRRMAAARVWARSSR
ncbi:M48 family metallopeptidase [Planosporangium thailandense]|uniref:M48 family metallopeptidase n=1 Tax=Planosporangium thailandense TaxID=765197 RepID=A0ABX0XUL8_9ACTN|nr:M48 family metallopeptidase [Planosporangium thailandense]NJC69707.1 M48 family metallopeptidase [Planosporangium thailandense]